MVLLKSMFPESKVKGEYMFLDFINKYFIQLSMLGMWWRRALSCGAWLLDASVVYVQEN